MPEAANRFDKSNPSKPRARLTEAEVLTIFGMKDTAPSSTCLANFYGVHEKTVRDIWTGRTWSRETWHLDAARAVHIKSIGRPKGRKDSMPRKKRAATHRKKSFMVGGMCSCPQHPTMTELHLKQWGTQQFGGEQQQSYPPESQEMWSIQQEIIQNSRHAAQTFPVSNSNTAAFPSVLTTRGIHAPSIDDQIHDWSHKLWTYSLPADMDPFLHDWNPTACNVNVVEEPQVAAC